MNELIRPTDPIDHIMENLTNELNVPKDYIVNFHSLNKERDSTINKPNGTETNYDSNRLSSRGFDMRPTTLVLPHSLSHYFDEEGKPDCEKTTKVTITNLFDLG